MSSSFIQKGYVAQCIGNGRYAIEVRTTNDKHYGKDESSTVRKGSFFESVDVPLRET